MTSSSLPAGANATNVVAGWADAHRYSPAPRHRRRLIRRILSRLDGVSDCLDAGCGQPFLVNELGDRLGLECYGCDISDEVMGDSQMTIAQDRFRVLDLERERWPEERRFDAVVCSEVLEHLGDWRAGLANVAAMSSRWVLITVPGGRRREMDRMVGHHRHFSPADIAEALREEGFEIEIARRWGFPVHSLYRALISRLGAERMYDSFAEGSYGPAQRALSSVLYAAFFVNDLFRSGDQVIVLGRRG